MLTILGVSLVNVAMWFLFGLLVGCIVHLIDPGDVRGGVFGTAVLGILGALVGGFLATVLFGHSFIGFSLQGFITAVFGGLILAFLSRLVFRNHGHIKTQVTQLR